MLSTVNLEYKSEPSPEQAVTWHAVTCQAWPDNSVIIHLSIADFVKQSGKQEKTDFLSISDELTR